jgi:hypothetical protein
MAIYTTDFSEYATGSPLSDWTDFWATGDFTYNAEVNSGSPVAGTKWLDYVSTASTRQVVTWDDVGSVSDCDLLGLFTAPAAAGVRLQARVGGTSGSEDSYHAELTSSSFRLVKYVSGSGTIISSASLDLEESAHYWVRFKVSGTSLKAKVWNALNIEPSDWMLEDVDSSLTSGRVGVGVATSSADFQCDYFEAATSTDVVTFPPSGWVADTKFGPFNLDFDSYTVSGISLFAGGNFPVGAKLLTGFRIYVGGTHSAQVRCAVYSGGSASDPDGATLLYDFGETSGSGVDQWLEFSGASVNIPQSSFLWLAVKGTGGFIMTRAAVGNAGNMQVAQGSSYTSSLDETPAVAWPGALTSLSWATASDYYTMEAIFEEVIPLSPPTGSLTLTGATPLTGVTVLSGALTLTTGTPIPSVGVSVSIPSGVLTLTGTTPAPVVAVAAYPPTGQMQLTGGTPAVGHSSLAVTLPVIEATFEMRGSNMSLLVDLPLVDFLAEMSQPSWLQVELPVFAAEFLSGSSLEIELPVLEAAFTSVTGATCGLNVALPEITFAAQTGSNLLIDVPLVDILFAGTSGTAANLVVALPPISTLFGARVETLSQLVVTLPVIQSVLTLQQDILGRLVVGLPPISCLFEASVGSIASLNVTLPALEALFTQYEDITGNLVVELPALRAFLEMSHAGRFDTSTAAEIANTILKWRRP